LERGNAWARLTPNISPVRSQSLLTFSILLFFPLRLLSGTGVQGLHGVRRQLPDLRERDDLQPVRRGKNGRDSKGVGGVGGALVSCNAACAFAHAPLIAWILSPADPPIYLSILHLNTRTRTRTRTHTGLQAVRHRRVPGLPCRLCGVPGHRRLHDLLHTVQCQLWPVQHGLVH
jgi:hypothetical protein